LGVAVGLAPIAPLQTLVAVALAFLLRLNRLAVLAGTLVWQPFTAPFILGAEVALGRALVGGGEEVWRRWGLPAAAGAAVIAPAGGLLCAAVVFSILKRRSGRTPKNPRDPVGVSIQPDRQAAPPSVPQEGGS
jgi:phosphate/sulfate permease